MKYIPVLLAATLTACQPQTESRERMDLVANRMSDSILKLIDSSLAQPGKILVATESSTYSFTTSLAPTSGSK
ncbi:MAG: hypothetical protein KA163_04780 [Bacteroidia bacterium]|nr:hypothetical protein [Bacteroidia bacterium]